MGFLYYVKDINFKIFEWGIKVIVLFLFFYNDKWKGKVKKKICILILCIMVMCWIKKFYMGWEWSLKLIINFVINNIRKCYKWKLFIESLLLVVFREKSDKNILNVFL